MSESHLTVRAPDVLTVAPVPSDVRLTVTDRLSLRLGLWLLLRSARRLQRPGDHSEHSRRRRNETARVARERHAERRRLLAPLA
jgi:hypothetical protein